jgi:hypothetical protein
MNEMGGMALACVFIFHPNLDDKSVFPARSDHHWNIYNRFNEPKRFVGLYRTAQSRPGGVFWPWCIFERAVLLGL